MSYSSKFSAGFLGVPATVGQVAGPVLKGPSIHLRETIAGICPLVELKVDGTPVQCLVDTGSQVTIFTESLCKKLFKNKPVEVGDVSWLTLRAANGLDIPYVGYILADFEVKEASVPTRGIVIVRDGCLGTNQALLGMNVTSACWEEVCQGHQRTVSALVEPRKKDWETVLAELVIMQ